MLDADPARQRWRVVADGLESLWALVCIVLFAKTFLGTLDFGDIEAGVAPTSPIFFGIALILYIGILPFLLLAAGEAWRRILRYPEILLLILLAFISASWSVDPALTLRRAFALVGTTTFALWMAIRFDGERIIRLVSVALVIGVMSSFLYAAINPSRAIHHGDLHDGAWRGVFFHKNLLGQAMALWTCIAIQAMGTIRRHAWLEWLGVAGGFALILLSTSKAGLGTAVIILLVSALLRIPRITREVRLAIVLVAGLAVVAFVFASPDAALGGIGGETTLTGRTAIWSAALETGFERPWTGFGYRAFWLGLDGPSAHTINQIGYMIPHGHSGFLDVFLELGVIGFGLVCLLILRAAWVIGKPIIAGRVDPWSRSRLALLIALLTISFVSSPLLGQNDVFWLLFLVALFSHDVGRSNATPA